MLAQFAYNSSKAAASHLTKMLATEFALKKIPVRVCGVAPGVYESQMTAARLAQPNGVNHVGLGIIPVPAGRAGRFVSQYSTNCSLKLINASTAPKKWRVPSYTLSHRRAGTPTARRSSSMVVTSP